MVYQGSKNRLTKYIIPIIQKEIDKHNITTYIEPFVGGANVIDKIRCENKIGSDINEELIALLKYIQEDNNISIAPSECSFEHYAEIREARKLKTEKFSKEYTALIGYAASYGGGYFDGGYGRHKAGSGSERNVYKETIKNMREHAPLLKGTNFINMNYNDYNSNDFNNCLFYCDPPYKGTKGYENGKYSVEYEEYYNWLRKISKNNYVICSEYSMPEDFECIWSKEVNVLQKSNRIVADKAVESLWRCKNGLY